MEQSAQAVKRVADWYEQRGWEIEYGKARQAPSRDQWKAYVDDGDFYARWDVCCAVRQRIEVKRLSYMFTCREDWPFGDVYLVCAKHSFDNADPKPKLYFHLNPPMTHAGVVPSSTYDRWTVVTKTDRRYVGVEQECYAAPLDCVSFIELKEPE